MCEDIALGIANGRCIQYLKSEEKNGQRGIGVSAAIAS